MAKIMVVDDEESSRRLIAKRLTAAGYTVVTYPHPLVAIPAIPVDNPEVILLDINMPEMDGRAACRQIRAEFPAIPVIFVTAQDQEEQLVAGLNLGARDYITKPIKPAELLARVQAALRDKAERDTANLRAETFERLAIIDPLSGLYNRRFFETQLEKELMRAVRYGHTLSCIMVDIDDFKAVNDTCGHATGDQVIKTVAEILKAGVRASDIVTRFGGEEFVILLPETNIIDASALADRLRQRIAAVVIGPGMPRFTASFGISASMANDLVENADKALYEAKRLGRNRVERWPSAEV